MMTVTPILTSKRIPKKVHAAPTSETFYFSLLVRAALWSSLTLLATLPTRLQLQPVVTFDR